MSQTVQVIITSKFKFSLLRYPRVTTFGRNKGYSSQYCELIKKVNRLVAFTFENEICPIFL